LVKNKKESKEYIFYALPVLFILTVFMFAIRGAAVRAPYEGFFWYTGNEMYGDIYAYFRMQLFLIVTAIAIVYLLISVFSGSAKIYKNKVYIPMAIFVLMVLLSYTFSEYKDLAAIGYSERYENTFVLICYMLIMFYSMNMINDERAFKIIFYGFIIACSVLGIWGIFQANGIDISHFPKWLYIPKKIRAAELDKGSLAVAVKWFFGNQNYTSFFMVFPVVISGMLLIYSKEMKMKILYTALLCLMLFSLWNTSSLGGMVGLGVSGVFALVFFRKHILKWKKSVVLMILAIIVSVGASLPALKKELGTVAENSGFIKTVFANTNGSDGLKYVDIDYIKTEGADVTFDFSGTVITVKTDNNTIEGVYDANGNNIGLEGEYYTVAINEDVEDIYTYFNVFTAKQKWAFAIVEDEVWFASPSGQGIKLDKTESIGFKGNEEFGTNRGYIWSRTLPLLKKTVLIGHGADTFIAYFPHDDYAGKYNVGFYVSGLNILVDKPHNMYLGSAVNTGIISVIALISIFVIYIADSLKAFRKCNYERFIEFMGAGILVATTGFLVAGFVNDSTVQIMPMFYSFVGLGFAINRIMKNTK